MTQDRGPLVYTWSYVNAVLATTHAIIVNHNEVRGIRLFHTYTDRQQQPDISHVQVLCFALTATRRKTNHSVRLQILRINK